MKPILLAFGVALIAITMSCAPLSRPATQREQAAALGGLTGGAGGAIIGSMAGGAVAGGLFGLPIGAVAGWYVGDQMERAERANAVQMEQNERELERLRRENERYRREAKDGQAGGARLSSRDQQAAPTSNEQDITDSAATSRVREAQKKLNDMGFHAGKVDGLWGPQTQAAIRNFQQSEGLQATGQLDQQTINALGIEQPAGDEKQTSARSDQKDSGSQWGAKTQQK